MTVKVFSSIRHQNAVAGRLDVMTDSLKEE